MCADDVETGFAKGFRADAEGIDGGVVLRQEELLAWLHLAELVAGVQALEACFTELLTNGFDCQEIHWRVV